MSGDSDEEPAVYEEFLKLSNLRMQGYRLNGSYTMWESDKIRDAAKRWKVNKSPGLGLPLIFDPRRQDFEAAEFSDLGQDVLEDDAKKRLTQVERYFSKTHGSLHKMQRVLGAGGQGLNVHYNYVKDGASADVVVKVSLEGWRSPSLRSETKMTMQMRRAAHCIQALNPEQLDLTPMDQLREEPVSEDSSDEEADSGDESLDGTGRPAQIPRRNRNPAEQAERDAAVRERIEAWERIKVPKARKDYLLLEYVPGGDFETIIARFIEATAEGQFAFRIPNKVLWNIWLCMVRACVAMKYPPRKFHPFRPRPPRLPANASNEDVQRHQRAMELYANLPGQLIETVPPPNRRFRAKNIIHFDIDPSNIFLSALEELWPGTDRIPGEHAVIPPAKLADFGLARHIKRNKRNQYYLNNRFTGKWGFYCPEQFGPEWETTGVDGKGPELSENPVAGNFGSHTNVWGMALTLWTIITQKEPPTPPQPQFPPSLDEPHALPDGVSLDQFIELADENYFRETGIRRRTPISYCPYLASGGPDGCFLYIDVRLRETLHRCMNHRPEDRPSVEDLLEEAKIGALDNYPYETEEVVRNWLNENFYSAPMAGDD
ncbi:kinase-like protein [Hypoxylon sp. FL1150]|nr:kinase-like protein [Hypoxylon sp. FL1150]